MTNIKKTIGKIVLFTSSTILLIGAGAFFLNNNTDKVEAYAVVTDDSYYSSISNTSTGTTLLKELQSLNATNRKKTVGYGAMGTSASGQFKYTDYDPATVKKDSNGQPYGTKILSFYSGTSTTNWNREHVWPDTHGGGKVENDIHMPRPTIPAENSNRGHSYYVEGKSTSASGWDPITAFGVNGVYPGVRGECARIIFYCMVADNTLVIEDTESSSTKNNKMGKLSDLLSWSLENEVTPREINRNNGAQYLQGNRNPFIDHPEYACKIWGNTNSSTKEICSKYNVPPTKITINPSIASLAVEGTLSLSVVVDKGSNMVTWSSSNPSVVSVDNNGVIKGTKKGTATITATSVLDTNVKGSLEVNVKDISSLEVTGNPKKTSYVEGEKFDPNGLTINAILDDNTSLNVTKDVMWSPSPLTKGTTQVVGTYAGKNITIKGITVLGNYYVTLSKSNTGLPEVPAKEGGGTKEDFVKSYSINNLGKSISLKWSKGCYNTKEYNEFAISYNSTLSSNDSTFVTTLTMDFYHGIDCEVYSKGIKVTPKSGTPTATSQGVVYDYTINSNDWYIKGTDSEYAQCFYSMVINISDSEIKPVSVTSVSLNKTSLTLNIGDSETLIETVAPQNATNKTVSWTSNNPEVAVVINGKVEAKSIGKAIITVKTEDGGKSATCNVEVVNDLIAVTSVSLNKDSLVLNVGDTEILTATINPIEASNKEVIWSSSNPNVAKVEKGKITALSEGTVRITVITKDGEKKASCSVTVLPKDVKSNKGCKGSIAITSIVVSSLSLLGAGLLLIKKKVK